MCYKLHILKKYSDISQGPISLGLIDGFMQDCSNSIANAMELQQSCTKPSKYDNTIPEFPISLVLRRHITLQ